MNGFFPEGRFRTAKSFSETSQCGACGLYKKCNTPKMKVFGKGEQKILFVFPPLIEQQDRSSNIWKSPVANHLRTMLMTAGVTPATEAWFTSALICHTPNPTNDQVDKCSHKLKTLIEELKPNVVVPIGNFAVRSIIQFTWKRSAGKPDRWYDQTIKAQTHNIWVTPVPEPTFDEERRDFMTPLFFANGIQKAFQLCESKPFKKIPDYASRVVHLSGREAELYLRDFYKKPFVAGFDYETNCLKPDNEKLSRIVSGAFAPSPRESIAFPWFDNLPRVLKKLNANPRGYWLASNKKYEQRWTRSVIGFRIRRWLWDTMLAAHTLDSRGGRDEGSSSSAGGGLSSLKVQAFILLGQPCYDDHIKDFLDTQGESYRANRIHQIELHDLLQYNGMDALMTWLVAREQMIIMGHPALELMTW